MFYIGTKRPLKINDFYEPYVRNATGEDVYNLMQLFIKDNLSEPVYMPDRVRINDTLERKINAQVHVNLEDMDLVFIPYTVGRNDVPTVGDCKSLNWLKLV